MYYSRRYTGDGLKDWVLVFNFQNWESERTVPFFGTNLKFQGHWAPTKLADKKRVENTTVGCISRGGRTLQIMEIIEAFNFLENGKGGILKSQDSVLLSSLPRSNNRSWPSPLIYIALSRKSRRSQRWSLFDAKIDSKYKRLQYPTTFSVVMTNRTSLVQSRLDHRFTIQRHIQFCQQI